MEKIWLKKSLSFLDSVDKCVSGESPLVLVSTAGVVGVWELLVWEVLSLISTHESDDLGSVITYDNLIRFALMHFVV